MNTTVKLYKKWLITALLFLIISLILVITGIKKETNSSESANLPITVYPKDPDSTYIAFNKNYAAPGEELSATVINPTSDGEFKYTWYINNDAIDNYNFPNYTPTNDDLEKFISVVATGNGKSATASIYCSKLPVIYIDTTSSIGDEYTNAAMAMSGNSEYTPENTEFYYGNIKIKLRGNSTRSRDKHPYKIVLDTKCNLFNMGASKHWVLLANDIDHTFIRNKLTYDFSGALGSEYMESLNVSVILNNSYVGVYQLCEQIRIADTRINILNWDDYATQAAKMIANIKKETEGMSDGTAKLFIEQFSTAMKLDLSWVSSPYTFTYQGTTYNISDYIDIPSLTGGFLLEMDFYNINNISSIKTNFQQPLYFNSPEPEAAVTNKELMEYAKKYMQSFEYALHSYDFTFHNNEKHYTGTGIYYNQVSEGWVSSTAEAEYTDNDNDGKHYTELFDIDSLVNNFLVCEFAMNWDSMKNSVFIFKDIDSLAKLGPQWDFDWAYGNNNMYSFYTYFPEGWHTTNNYFTNEQYYQSVQWNRYLIKDPYFLLCVYNKYKEIRKTGIEDIIKSGGLLDKYYNELKEAGAANDAKWSYSYGEYNGETFIESMNSLKNFINTRVSWLDKQFTDFDTFVNSLGYYVKDDSITISHISQDGNVTVNVSDSSIKKIRIQVNGSSYNAVSDLNDSSVTFKIPSAAINQTGHNVINVIALDDSSQYITKGSLSVDNIENIDNLKPRQTYKTF